MTFRLRQATPDDHTTCLEILHAADEDDKHIRAAMSDTANTTYLAYDGESVVGAAVMQWSDTEAEIVYIAVTEKMRGQGFGKQIIAELINHAHSRGMSAILVGTANSSLENIAFYQKCGFRMDHVRRDYFSYFTEPVMDNGILILDMIVFRMALD